MKRLIFSAGLLWAAGCSGKTAAPSPAPAPAPAAGEAAASTPAATGNAAVDYSNGLQSAVQKAQAAAAVGNQAVKKEETEVPKE